MMKHMAASLCGFMVAASLALAGDDQVSGPAVDVKPKDVYRFVAAELRDNILMVSGGGSMNVKQPNTAIQMADLNGQKILVLCIDNGGRITQLVKTLKPGAWVTANLESKLNNVYVKQFKEYTLFTGEADPGVFAYVTSDKRAQGSEEQMAIQLYKLGKVAALRVTVVKDPKSGNTAPSADVSAAVEKLAAGDIVEADISNGVIKAIWRYTAPVTGMVQSVGGTTIGDVKTVGIEVEVDGIIRKFIVAVKTDTNGKMIADAATTEAVRSFKAHDKIIVKYRTTEQGDVIREVRRPE